jgi:hypothetical protein
MAALGEAVLSGWGKTMYCPVGDRCHGDQEHKSESMKALLFHALWSFESRPQDRVRRTRDALEEPPVHGRNGHWGEAPDRRGRKAPKCVISPTPNEFIQLGRSTMLADIAETLSLPHTVIGWGGFLGTLSCGLSAACPPWGGSPLKGDVGDTFQWLPQKQVNKRTVEQKSQENEWLHMGVCGVLWKDWMFASHKICMMNFGIRK